MYKAITLKNANSIQYLSERYTEVHYIIPISFYRFKNIKKQTSEKKKNTWWLEHLNMLSDKRKYVLYAINTIYSVMVKHTKNYQCEKMPFLSTA